MGEKIDKGVFILILIFLAVLVGMSLLGFLGDKEAVVEIQEVTREFDDRN